MKFAASVVPSGIMALPDLFKKKASLTCLRPAGIQQLGLSKQPESVEKPQLLQRLELCLQQARLAANSLHSHSTVWGATKLEVDVYRQVFDTFIASMTTYRPLLLRIKQSYDQALEDATASAYDHVHLQTEVSMLPQRYAEAVAVAKAAALTQAENMLEELINKLQDLEQQAAQAEQECKETDDQLHHYQKHILQARRELDQLELSNRRAYKDLVDNSSWQQLAALPALSNAAGSHVGKAYGLGG